MSILAASFYPEPLTAAEGEKPLDLWYQGNPSILEKPLVAVVGTRGISQQGDENTRRLAAMLVKANCAVVSGLAKGVDRAAHEAALDAGGLTVAVMGTPIEDCYPKEHRDLKARIAEDGLVLSQFPPESKVHRSNFPRRNELMARLCRVTFIVEASVDSGTKHQVKAALRLGHKIGFLRPLWEMEFPWVLEAAQQGLGFCIESRRDVLALLKLADLISVETPVPAATSETNESVAKHPEFAFDIPTRPVNEPKRKRSPKKKNASPEASQEQPPLPGTS